VKRVTWSNSRLNDFEKCKKYFKIKHIDKVPEPPRPLKPGQTEQPNERGTRVHTAGELFVKGGVELVPELHSYAEEFPRLRELYAQGKVSLEGEWAFDDAWRPVGYWSDDVWVRVKLDALVWLNERTVLAIDYKTGKKYGNEFKHAEQMALYQLAVFLKYPEVETVHVELWYVDQDDLTRQVYSRRQGERYIKPYTVRGMAVTTCTDFPPAANQHACRFCYYGQKKGIGLCTSEI
jgi:RecB family exonuclease